MIADDLSEIVGPLELLLALSQGTVATVRIEREADLGLSIALNMEVRNSRGEERIQVQTRNAGVLGGACADVARKGIHPIAHEAKAEFVHHGAADAARVPQRKALIPSGSRSREPVARQRRTAEDPKSTRSGLIEILEAVPAKNRLFVADEPVPPSIPVVGVERIRTGADVVIEVRGSGVPRCVRAWQHLQDIERLLAEHALGDRIVDER